MPPGFGYIDDGYRCYDILFLLMRTKIRSQQRLPLGPASIQIETGYVEAKPSGPLKVSMAVNGEDYGSAQVPISAPLLFSANDCLDIGTCLGDPVSLDYYDRAPFPFNGTIKNVNVRYAP